MNTKTIIIIFIAIAIILYMLMPRIIKSNEAYNAYACAVQGYQADCTTPLTASERLK